MEKLSTNRKQESKMQKIHYKKVGILTEQGHPCNARGYPGDTIELQQAIARDGQRTPLTVTEPNEDGVYILTRGHRRKAAIDALRAEARKKVREIHDELAAWAEATDSNESDPRVVECATRYQQAKDAVERYSYYAITTNGINPSDTLAILRDMDAGIINEPVNPVALGETIVYRMDKLGWTFHQCCESLQLNESKARACVRAADPELTAESVRRLLRTFEMSLFTFIKKMSRLDVQTQQKVVELSETRTTQTKRGHGVINAGIIDSVIAEISGESTPAPAPDVDVLPLLGTAKENIYLALNIQNQWSPATWEAAMWQLQEIILTVSNALKEQEQRS